MIRSSMFFTYANINSESKHIINCNVDSSGMLSEPFIPSRSILETKSRFRKKPYFQQIQYEPLTFTMTIALEDDFLWDEKTLRDISSWLCQDTYQPLFFNDYPDRIFYCVCTNEVNIIHNCLRQGYVNLTMRCDSPYSYSPYILLPESQYGNDFIVVNGTKSIEIQNNGQVDIYPEIWIEKINSNGKIEIINTTNRNNNTLIFNEGSKSIGNLTVTGSLYQEDTIVIGNDVYEVNTSNTALTYNTRKRIDLSPYSTFAEGRLVFSNIGGDSNPSVVDGETITINNQSYEFDDDGIYSSANIPINIADTENYATGTLVLNTNPFNGETITIGKQQYKFVGDVNETQIMNCNHNLSKQPFEALDIDDYLMFYNDNKKEFRIAEIIDNDNIQLRYININSSGYWQITKSQGDSFGFGVFFNDNRYISDVFPIVPIKNQSIKDSFTIAKHNKELSLYNKLINGFNADLSGTIGQCNGNTFCYKLLNTSVYANNDKILPKAGDLINITLFSSNGSDYRYGKVFMAKILEITNIVGTPFQNNKTDLSVTMKLDKNIPDFYTSSNINSIGIIFNSKIKDLNVNKSQLNVINQIKIENTKEETIQNIVHTLNGNESNAGVSYSQGSINQSDILIANVNSTNTNKMNLQYKKKGYIGNSIITHIDSYDSNNRFEDNIGHPINTLIGGTNCGILTALSKLSTEINNKLNNNSVIQSTTVNGNELIVKAKIAGSDGNNILTTSACQNAVWSKNYNNGYTLYGGTDASLLNSVTAIKTAINNNNNKDYEIILNNNPNIITVQYKEIGDKGNIPISSTAYNANWDDTKLSGGISELQVGETVYINEKGQVKSSLEDTQQVYRYDTWNKVRLSLMANSSNRLIINGDCNIKFRYRCLSLQE